MIYPGLCDSRNCPNRPFLSVAVWSLVVKKRVSPSLPVRQACFRQRSYLQGSAEGQQISQRSHSSQYKLTLNV